LKEAATTSSPPAKRQNNVAYTKLALKRDPDVPAGQPAPMHLDCPCGQQVPADDDVNECACGATYDHRGYVITPSAASKTEPSPRYAPIGRIIPDAF